MAEPWTPRLQLHESDGRCRLELAGVTCGSGASLQEAADELVARLLHLVAALRNSGFRVPRELGPPDLRVFAFLHELDAIASRGGDIRKRIFGFPDETDLAA